MRWRPIQPAIFGLVALSFLLPFANMSCSTDPDIAQSGSPVLGPSGETEVYEMRGYELVIGKGLEGAVAEGFAIEPGDVRYGGEPFAVVALGAALAGFGLSFLSSERRRAVATLAAALAGTFATIVLGLAPVIGSYGLLKVSWRVGYAACLALFAGAVAVSYLGYRDARPPPYVRERLSDPPGGASG